MPASRKTSGKSRHDPLLVQLGGDDLEAKYGRVSQPGKRKKSKNTGDEEDASEGDVAHIRGQVILDPKTSKRIFELARDQQDEMEMADEEEDAQPSALTRPRLDDDEDEDSDLGDVEDEDVEEIFNPCGYYFRETRKRGTENAAVIKKVHQDREKPDPALGLDPKVVAAYSRLGLFLHKYTSGPLPKIFKVIPSLPAWARLLALTQPENWSPHACLSATRLFISSMKPPQAQLFLSVVLLDAIQADIQQNKKLNVHYYDALRRALYKPGAFFKGIIFPMLDQGCSLKEAAIVASVLARTKIPVLHASAALIRIAEMDYSGPNSLFIRVLVDKKFDLPYKVVDALVFHFIRLSNTYKARTRADADALPVLWHQSLLVFAQRYASDLTPDQKDALLDVVRATPHAQIGPEIRRELVNSVVRGAPRTDGDIEMM
ncbi:Bystin-domain-containing protein [Mycena rosella]|uniref:Bystin-domain-containing protein n=1 Tax=Mycena rosella TaxID=1033263 RepID=A0AAD7G6Q6_MYCRO|nr:Bystin-domain-containing protein [Mycena rosella]